MKKGHIELIKEIFNLLILTFTPFSIVVLLVSGFGNPGVKGFLIALAVWMALSIVQILFHLACKYIDVIPEIIRPDTSSFYSRSRLIFMPPLVYVISIMVGHYAGVDLFEKGLIVVLMIVLILAVGENYLRQFDNFLVVNNSNSAVIAQKKILDKTLRLTLFFGLTLGAIYIVLFFNLDLVKELERVLGELLARLKPGPIEVDHEELAQAVSQSQGMGQTDMSALDDMVETNNVLAVLIRIFLYFITSLAVVFGGYLLSMGIKDLIYFLLHRERKIYEEKTVDVLGGVTEETKRIQRNDNSPESAVSGLREYLSYEQRVRRKYKKYIQKNDKKLSDVNVKSATPRECDERLHMGKLLDEYEEIRYNL